MLTSSRTQATIVAAAIVGVVLAACSSTHSVDCMRGITPAGTFYTHEQLPTGSCDDDGAECGVTVGYPCNGGSACPVNGETCRCENGSWRCFISSQGACACVDKPSLRDANAGSD